MGPFPTSACWRKPATGRWPRRGPTTCLATPSFEPASINITGIAIGDVTDDGRNDVVCSKGGGQPGAALMGQIRKGGSPSPGRGTLSRVCQRARARGRRGDAYSDIVSLHNNAPYLVLSRQTIDGVNLPHGCIRAIANDLYRPDGLAVGDINSDGLGRRDHRGADSGLVVLRHVSDPPPKVTLTRPHRLVGGADGPHLDGERRRGVVRGLRPRSTAVFSRRLRVARACPPAHAVARWASPGPAATGVRVRVATVDAAGYTGASQATVELITPTLAVTVTLAYRHLARPCLSPGRATCPPAAPCGSR